MGFERRSGGIASSGILKGSALKRVREGGALSQCSALKRVREGGALSQCSALKRVREGGALSQCSALKRVREGGALSQCSAPRLMPFHPHNLSLSISTSACATEKNAEKASDKHFLGGAFFAYEYNVLPNSIGDDIVLSDQEFITMSIDLNLFFLRIMKEHSLFLQLAFTPKDSAAGEEAAGFRTGFENLLTQATELASGNVSRAAIESQQITTPYTMEAERLTYFYTGVPVNTSLTQRQTMLRPYNRPIQAGMAEAVEMLDRRAYQLTASLAEFKEKLLANVRSCRMFTMNYPLLIEHILREARFFMNMLVALVSRDDITTPEGLINQEAFWNRIMAEHSKFIAGLLDPSEETLIDTARDFGRQFDALTAAAVQATRQTAGSAQVTAQSLEETKKLRDFKAAGASGILECKIESIIIPLLADHVLREANHYLCVLGTCEQSR